MPCWFPRQPCLSVWSTVGALTSSAVHKSSPLAGGSSAVSAAVRGPHAVQAPPVKGVATHKPISVTSTSGTSAKDAAQPPAPPTVGSEAGGGKAHVRRRCVRPCWAFELSVYTDCMLPCALGVRRLLWLLLCCAFCNPQVPAWHGRRRIGCRYRRGLLAPTLLEYHLRCSCCTYHTSLYSSFHSRTSFIFFFFFMHFKCQRATTRADSQSAV